MRRIRYAIALVGFYILIGAEDVPGCIPEPQYPKKCDGLPNPPDAGGESVSPSWAG